MTSFIRENDREIRELFAELRRRECVEAPPFRAVWTRAEEEKARKRDGAPRAMTWAAGLAGAGVLALLVALPLLTGERGRPAESRKSERGDLGGEPLTLSQWRAPTDVLLQVPGAEILAGTPDLGSSIVSITSNAVRWDANGEMEENRT